jgi:hypothetical protein
MDFPKHNDWQMWDYIPNEPPTPQDIARVFTVIGFILGFTLGVCL